MSGTSVDGINAVLVAIEEPKTLRLMGSTQLPFDPALRTDMLALMQTGAQELHRYAILDRRVGEAFAAAATTVLHTAGLTAKQVRAIGSHGQTVRHMPNAQPPYTIQIGNPSIIAERTGITTVADFRARDMAAGGQGAPLVPAFHQWCFQSHDRHRVVLNIGGIANISDLPRAADRPVIGFDTGPGNTLLDAWIACERGESFDRDGAWSASAEPDQRLVELMLADSYFAAPAPKSTGREHFNLPWLEAVLRRRGAALAPATVQASLAELTVRSIALGIDQLPKRPEEIWVCGGGAHNRDLMQRLARHLAGLPVATTADLGLDPDWVEACAFAWLAHRTLEAEPGNLPSVTGASRAVILGGIYPA